MPEQLMNEQIPNSGGMPIGSTPMPTGPTGPTPNEVAPIEPTVGETMPMGAMPQEQAPMDEQSMRQDIERKMSDVESQNNALETKKFIAKNKIKNFKIEMLRDIYAMLQKLGVDPNDPQSIKNFLLSLEQQDPDLLTLFETIFDVMSPDSKTAIDELSTPVEQTMPVEGDNGPNLMDKYSNLQEQVLR